MVRKKAAEPAVSTMEAGPLQTLTLSRKPLLEACKLAASVCPKTDVKPILQCLQLQAADGVLRIAATDLERGVMLTLHDPSIEGTGTLLVEAELLVKSLGRLDTDQVTFRVEEEELHVEDPHCHLTLRTRTESFPDIPEPEGEPTCKVLAGVLADLIERVMPALGDDDPTKKFYMKPCCWKVGNGQLELQATDGRCLVVACGAAPFQQSVEGDTLIPPSTLRMLAAIARIDPDQDVEVWVGKNEIYFRVATALLYGRLVEGRFPPVRSALTGHKRKASGKTTAGELVRACRQAELACTAEKTTITAELGPDGITLTSAATGRGQSQAEISADVKGQDKVMLLPGNLIDALKVLPAETPVLVSSGGSTPFLVTWGDDYIFGCMPMV